MKYVGLGLYVDKWERYFGPEGNLKRKIKDVYDSETQFAHVENPDKFVGTYATYVEIEGRNKE